MADTVPPWLRKDPFTGLGSEAVWGSSPSMDVLHIHNDLPQGGAATVLFTGVGDIRHVLHTMSRCRRHGVRELTFLLHEPNLRSYARHLLLLQFIFELDATDDLEEKTYIFLELFGNLKLRESTYRWLKTTAKRLGKLICNQTGVLADVVDFEDMKAKERDWVEDQFKAWGSELKDVNVDSMWDHRMRRDMADRYDSRVSMIDWDFHMGLSDVGAPVKFPEYRNFRNEGMPFPKWYMKSVKIPPEYIAPNVSLLHYDRRREVFHYAGDIKNSPHPCFGVETENGKIIAKEIDGSYRLGACVIAFHNVRAMLHEWVTGRPWDWTPHSLDEEEPAIKEALEPGSPVRVRVRLLTLDVDRTLMRMGHAGALVDVCVAGVMVSSYMERPALWNVVRLGGIVLTETAKFILEFRDEHKAAYIEKLVSMALDGRDEEAEGRIHALQILEKQRDGQEQRKERLRSLHCLAFRKSHVAAALPEDPPEEVATGEGTAAD